MRPTMLLRHLLSIAMLPFVVAINHTYFLLLEEPGLAARFGAEYQRYREAVPRWLPRWRGWP